MARHSDPYKDFRFVVEVQGLTVGGFTEVSGLDVEIDTEEYREGGVNDSVHTLPKGSKHPRLVLKRGITDVGTLWEWQKRVSGKQIGGGKIERHTVRVVLLDSAGNEAMHWRCVDAYPAKWTGPSLKADGSSVAVESLELVHRGLRQ